MNCKFKAAKMEEGVWKEMRFPLVIAGGLIFLIGFLEIIVNKEIYAFPYTILLLLAVIVLYIFTPRSYKISNGKIYIKRIIGKVVIQDIKLAEVVEEIGLGMRLFGSAGAGGYFGKFELLSRGVATLYCTRLDRVGFIKTEKKVYLISPDEPEMFIKALKENL